jgi:hypothetical protein
MEIISYIKEIKSVLKGMDNSQLSAISVEMSPTLFEEELVVKFTYKGGGSCQVPIIPAAAEEIVKALPTLPELKKFYEAENSALKKNQQVCSHLEIEDFYSSSKDTLGDLMELQKEIQEKVYGYDFEHVQSTLGTVKEFIDWNYAADQDEWRELYNALGGVDSHGSAVWKPWKTKHKEALAKPFADLSESEKKELHMEIVDRFHFFLNICLATGLDTKTLFNYYYAKNKENRERQKRAGGY